MKRIDHETVQRILDAADIVEVVSDFVNLKRRGSNYMGLCPFHNERTPSFSVSKSKNICKCFSCGKGGSPVNFIMELEQLSYNEALRYLARKYNIEIKEHEMSDAEREAYTERESMLAVNDFALRHFEHNLHDTSDGRDIGLSYFLERGINEASVKRFHLGYALERSDDLYSTAIKQGYNEKYLVETGLCVRTDSGRVYDRFKGRVIYPVFSLSGKVVAFGGRTLRKDIAKYVNSPESLIYRKSYELYGLYQAKQAIVKYDKCILVEGYMDVISMHQSGIQNVVASSGTSLTEGQIRLIHRFTDNVTVIYDGDPAGIKASLRGIDMLLAEGLKIKILLLPDGHDPDSFAQSRSASELDAYINEHETDFIRFKTTALMHGVENDPIARSRVIADIAHSIAMIPNEIMRKIYVQDCSNLLDIDERTVNLHVEKMFKERAEKEGFRSRRDYNSTTVDAGSAVTSPDVTTSQSAAKEEPVVIIPDRNDNTAFLRPYEVGVLRYVLRYGMMDFCEDYDAGGKVSMIKVIEYIAEELNADGIVFSNPDVSATYAEALKLSREGWDADYARAYDQLVSVREGDIARGEAEIRASVEDVAGINAREKLMIERVDEKFRKGIIDHAKQYLDRHLCSHPDSMIRNLSIELVSERHVLSKVHTKYAHIPTDDERLGELVPRAIYELKDAILECRLRKLHADIKAVASSPNADMGIVRQLMESHVSLMRLRGDIAKYLGERIVNPRK